MAYSQFLATAIVGTSIAPRLGFDMASVARSADGSWDGTWPDDLKDVDEQAVALTADRQATILVGAGHPIEAFEILRRSTGSKGTVEAERELVSRLGADLPVSEPTLPPESIEDIWSAMILSEDYRTKALKVYNDDSPSLSLMKLGPTIVTDVAERIFDAIETHLTEPILYGSLSAFLQQPYRLSPDIDITAPMPTPQRRAALLRSLRDVGAKVTLEREHHIGATIPGEVDVTIDCDFDTIYRQPLELVERSSLVEWNGWRLLSVNDLVMLKRRVSRPKDHSDLAFLGGNSK